MSYWITDPQLFLYAKGTGPDDVHLWRCKKPASSSSSSSLVVPMESDDFDYVSKVENHLELIADIFDWDAIDYKQLINYIFERHLLVNSHGFVIAELHKVDKDGNKTIDDANEEVPAIYIRSLDVLPLKPYIPKLRERPIPLRMVKYLGDVNGKAAPMEEDSTVTKLTARVDHLEAENIRLESKNNTLDSNVKTLEGKVTKLTADLVTQMNALATVQHELDRVKNGKEVWMNDLTNSEWVGIEGFSLDSTVYDNVIVVKPPGTFTVDDGTGTNVRARYWYKIQLSINGVINLPNFVPNAVCLDDLIPNKEKARFSKKQWPWALKYQGKIYIVSLNNGPVAS